MEKTTQDGLTADPLTTADRTVEPQTAESQTAESPKQELQEADTPPTDGKPEEPENPEESGPSEAQLAEAENRGYLRGRNERIAELMREPAVFERGSTPGLPPGYDWQKDSQPMILNNPRISIWDR